MAGTRKTKPAAQDILPSYIVAWPQGLNLRSGPGKETSILKVLPNGTRVSATGAPNEAGWLPVEGGWVDGRYVREV